MPSISYKSQIGKPLQLFGDAVLKIKFFRDIESYVFQPGFYPKNTFINGIMMKENEFFHHKESFFSRYQVYENFNGYHKMGKNHPKNLKIIKEDDWYDGFNEQPILVGDSYENPSQRVIYSSGYYDARFRLFHVHFQIGIISQTVPVTKVNTLNQELAKLEDLISEGFNTVINALGNLKNLFSLENIGTPTQGWAIPPHSIALNAQVEAGQNQIKSTLRKIKEQNKKIQELRW